MINDYSIKNEILAFFGKKIFHSASSSFRNAKSGAPALAYPESILADVRSGFRIWQGKLRFPCHSGMTKSEIPNFRFIRVMPSAVLLVRYHSKWPTMVSQRIGINITIKYQTM